MHVSPSVMTRRHILSTGLVALVSAFLPGAFLVQHAHADKKKPKIPTVAERTGAQREVCENFSDPPGKLAVLDGPNGGNTTECKGGSSNGHTCINTKKETKCWQARTEPPSSPLNGVGGPPSDSVNEQPSDGKPVGGGGAVGPTGGVEDPGGNKPVGGGASVDPTGGVEDPGGTTAPTDGPLRYKAGHVDRTRGKGKRRRRVKSRKA